MENEKEIHITSLVMWHVYIPNKVHFVKMVLQYQSKRFVLVYLLNSWYISLGWCPFGLPQQICQLLSHVSLSTTMTTWLRLEVGPRQQSVNQQSLKKRKGLGELSHKIGVPMGNTQKPKLQEPLKTRKIGKSEKDLAKDWVGPIFFLVVL